MPLTWTVPERTTPSNKKMRLIILPPVSKFERLNTLCVGVVVDCASLFFLFLPFWKFHIDVEMPLTWTVPERTTPSHEKMLLAEPNCGGGKLPHPPPLSVLRVRFFLATKNNSIHFPHSPPPCFNKNAPRSAPLRSVQRRWPREGRRAPPYWQNIHR